MIEGIEEEAGVAVEAGVQGGEKGVQVQEM